MSKLPLQERKQELHDYGGERQAVSSWVIHLGTGQHGLCHGRLFNNGRPAAVTDKPWNFVDQINGSCYLYRRHWNWVEIEGHGVGF